MAYIESSLSGGEKIEHIFRLHWVNKIPMILWLIATPFTFGLSLLFVIYEWLRLRGLEQGLTNRRIIRKTGIIARGTEEMQLQAVEHIGIKQGILGRIFDFGTVIIAGRGTGKIKICSITDPSYAKKKIESVIFKD